MYEFFMSIDMDRIIRVQEGKDYYLKKLSTLVSQLDIDTQMQSTIPEKPPENKYF